MFCSKSFRVHKHTRDTQIVREIKGNQEHEYNGPVGFLTADEWEQTKNA